LLACFLIVQACRIPSRTSCWTCPDRRNNKVTNNGDSVHIHDVAPVWSRVSWGAILAGLCVALTIFSLLALLAVAVGITTADQVQGQTLATTGIVVALITSVAAFFCGGYVTSRCTAGESRAEAALYGIVLCGATAMAITWMTGSVLQNGATAMWSTTNRMTRADAAANWEDAARRAGMSQEQVNQIRTNMPNAEQVREYSAQAAWWALANFALSLAAAVGGAVLGAGPTFQLSGVVTRRTVAGVGVS
jgi:hypothetical protein